MPIGIQRLNQRSTHPNDRIVFIKALPGPSHDTAVDFLNRIAAICVPIMRANHLSVMSLEEHEPNPEFVGRNFNAGEIVQLVLKAPGNGRWLSFRYVQMVMMHELAHCKQMNHSRAFWDVRNGYAEELRGLWSKSYTGDGLWGRGQSLYSGQYAEDGMPDASNMPQHLCGGTYRSRGRKRKRGPADKPKVSYAERKQKRIAKKFGTGGEIVGADEHVRMAMEKGKMGAKPRVAKSKRGRNLCAEAALLRFSQQQNAQRSERETTIDGSDEATDYEDDDLFEGEDAVDIGGGKLQDSKGRGMIKVCEDENVHDDADALNELAELTQIGTGNVRTPQRSKTHKQDKPNDQKVQVVVDEDDVSTEDDEDDHVSRVSGLASSSEAGRAQRGASSITTISDDETDEQAQPALHKPIDSAPVEFVRSKPAVRSEQVDQPGFSDQLSCVPASLTAERSDTRRDDWPANNDIKTKTFPDDVIGEDKTSQDKLQGEEREESSETQYAREENTLTDDRLPYVQSDPGQGCIVCSFINDSQALTCMACAHVLDTGRLTRFWKCQQDVCQKSLYVNAEDAGVCGICGHTQESDSR